MAHGNASAGRLRTAPRPFVHRPRLEMLEGRCLPSTVTNLNDAGAGSLRQAILDTPAGGTVDFQPGLSGTITLTSQSIPVRHGVMPPSKGGPMAFAAVPDAGRDDERPRPPGHWDGCIVRGAAAPVKEKPTTFSRSPGGETQ